MLPWSVTYLLWDSRSSLIKKRRVVKWDLPGRTVRMEWARSDLVPGGSELVFFKYKFLNVKERKRKYMKQNWTMQRLEQVLHKGICLNEHYPYEELLLLSLFSHSIVSDFCYPMDYSLPGSSVHGISQARILGWVATPFSRGSSQPKGQTRLSWIAGRFFTM